MTGVLLLSAILAVGWRTWQAGPCPEANAVVVESDVREGGQRLAFAYEVRGRPYVSAPFPAAGPGGKFGVGTKHAIYVDPADPREIGAGFSKRSAGKPAVGGILRARGPGSSASAPVPGEEPAMRHRRVCCFLIQFLGGDEEQTQSRWWLSLRESHARFRIDRKQRSAWLKHMGAALDGGRRFVNSFCIARPMSWGRNRPSRRMRRSPRSGPTPSRIGLRKHLTILAS
jgi:hypothetical protein